MYHSVRGGVRSEIHKHLFKLPINGALGSNPLDPYIALSECEQGACENDGVSVRSATREPFLHAGSLCFPFQAPLNVRSPLICCKVEFPFWTGRIETGNIGVGNNTEFVVAHIVNGQVHSRRVRQEK